MKNIIKFGIFYITLMSTYYGLAIEAVVSTKYQKPLQIYSNIQSVDTPDHSYELMIRLCIHFNISHKQLMKEMCADISYLKKELKVLSEKDQEELLSLLDQLRSLHTYVKNQKHNYEAILFHLDLKKRYKVFFDSIAEEQDIGSVLKEQSVQGQDIIKFVEDINMAHRRIEKFEDLIHADDVDVKLANYVFKIELIKLRNAILFHDVYKELKKKR